MIIRTENISKTYYNSRKNEIIAIKSASIEIGKGQTIGILGRSGSGKSTLGQIIVGQIKKTSGKVYYNEKEIKYPYKGNDRKEIQILYQHPEVSFNPRLTLYKSLMEPYKLYGLEFSKEILIRDIQRFGLYEEHLNRYPGELSGGELQRAAISRILTVNPSFIVLDEPTSMLDVISQAQIMHILKDIQREKGTSYLFITHNKTLCKAFSDTIYIINEGIVCKYDDSVDKKMNEEI